MGVPFLFWVDFVCVWFGDFLAFFVWVFCVLWDFGWDYFIFFLVECVVCGGDCRMDWWGDLNRLAIIQTAGCFCMWRLEINASMQVRI